MNGEFSERIIKQSIWIARPPQVVFLALIEPERLTKWLVPGVEAISKSPKKYRMAWSHHSFDVTYLESVPDKIVRMSWFSARGVGPEVSFAIESMNNGSFVSLVHAGFDPSKEHEETYFGHIEGWAMYLCNLKCYLDFGRDLRTDQPPGSIAK